MTRGTGTRNKNFGQQKPLRPAEARALGWKAVRSRRMERFLRLGSKECHKPASYSVSDQDFLSHRNPSDLAVGWGPDHDAEGKGKCCSMPVSGRRRAPCQRPVQLPPTAPATLLQLGISASCTPRRTVRDLEYCNTDSDSSSDLLLRSSRQPSRYLVVRLFADPECAAVGKC